jgi:hypothetical protein
VGSSTASKCRTPWPFKQRLRILMAFALQDYQKDAILRNYKLQKKEKEEVETRLAELVEKCRYHDDHIRAIDAWLHQVSTSAVCAELETNVCSFSMSCARMAMI